MMTTRKFFVCDDRKFAACGHINECGCDMSALSDFEGGDQNDALPSQQRDVVSQSVSQAGSAGRELVLIE
jgi:hypothetical protein